MLIELEIISVENLTIGIKEKLRKYDILSNIVGSIYEATTKIIPYGITGDGLVTKYHKKYLKELDVASRVKTYAQGGGLALRKTNELKKGRVLMKIKGRRW